MKVLACRVMVWFTVKSILSAITPSFGARTSTVVARAMPSTNSTACELQKATFAMS